MVDGLAIGFWWVGWLIVLLFRFSLVVLCGVGICSYYCWLVCLHCCFTVDLVVHMFCGLVGIDWFGVSVCWMIGVLGGYLWDFGVVACVGIC